MKQNGTTRNLLGNVAVITAALGVTGWVASLFVGQYLINNVGWLFNTLASILPLPPPYNQGSFIAQWSIYGLWWLLGVGILTLFIKRRKGQATTKFGPSRSRKR